MQKRPQGVSPYGLRLAHYVLTAMLAPRNHSAAKLRSSGIVIENAMGCNCELSSLVVELLYREIPGKTLQGLIVPQANPYKMIQYYTEKIR